MGLLLLPDGTWAHLSSGVRSPRVLPDLTSVALAYLAARTERPLWPVWR